MKTDPMVSKLLLSLLALASLTTPAAGQEFTCPVNSAGCASYQELVKAGDDAVSKDVRYVCFRQFSDEFFVVKSYEPLLFSFLWYKWNPKYAEYELNLGHQASAWVQFQTFQNGVANDSTMPNVFVNGKWFTLFGELSYSAVSRPAVAAKELPLTVTIDSSQVAVAETYEAQSGKRVAYTLTIQRSTKRFVEQFNVRNSPKESISYEGRCVEVAALPSLPQPPALTEDQQALRDKLAYCSDSPAPEDKGYCASSFTYPEDYKEAQKKKKTMKKQAPTGKPQIP